MITRNGEPRKYKMEGSSFLTDKEGRDMYDAVMKKHVGKEYNKDNYLEMQADINALFEELKAKGKLFHKDGFAVR